MKDKQSDVIKDFQKVAHSTVDRLEETTVKAQKRFDGAANPIRKHVLKRFPVLFSLLVTFGLIATFLGMELVLLEYQIFTDYPLILLSIGVLILVLTGTLYKKLG